jgi:hypothetical protein
MNKSEYFEITSVCRDDLEQCGFDASGVDDATMDRLARKMAAAYIKNSYWDDLETIADDVLGIPRKRISHICEECGSSRDIRRNGSGELQCDNCGWIETE